LELVGGRKQHMVHYWWGGDQSRYSANYEYDHVQSNGHFEVQRQPRFTPGTGHGGGPGG